MNTEIEIPTTQSMDAILAKHRQEKKDLQIKVTTMKKTIPKGDKKKKKEITDSIAKLEMDLEEKHKSELANTVIPSNTEEPMELTTNGDEAASEENEETDGLKQRVSRAQKRRNKKAEDEKDRNKRISEQDEKNKHGPRVKELNTIKEALGKMGLEIFNVPADGNCLYCAVNHQLKATGRDTSDVNKLRKLTAKFMLDNKEDFLPFMYNEDEEPFDEKKFDSYCKEVANTKLWGGQLELRALSNVLQCPIQVIQATGPTTTQGDRYTGLPLILTYHRHLYRLGEHYNATMAVEMGEEQDRND